ncbi:MAG: GNAT family N-acetyltransferase [Pseudobdellovibrionaceae bacterium]
MDACRRLFFDDRRLNFGILDFMSVILEKFKFNEVDEAHLLWSDEHATLYTNFPYLATLEQCRERLTKMANYYAQRTEHFGPFAIRSADGKFLGLTGGDAGEVLGEYEIWYFIQRDFWGQRVASSAVALLLEMMKRSGRVKLIKAEAVVDNLPSWRFLEKLGFQKKKVLPGGHQKHGKSWDRFLYVMPVTTK